MARKGNASDGETIRITVSKQSAGLLLKLAAMGIYGRNQSEVAGRFVDKALEAFVEAPKLRIDSRGESKKR